MNETKGNFALCLNNEGYPVSLEVRKVYQLLPTTEQEQGYLRVIDESGEDYLYPTSYFLVLDLPVEVEKSLAAA